MQQQPQEQSGGGIVITSPSFVGSTTTPTTASGGASSSTDSVAIWLHNKLHSPTHLWSFSSTVASQYTLEKLQAIRDCFASFEPLVKIKFFLTLFHVPKRNYEEVRF